MNSLTHPCNFEGIENEEQPQAERIAQFLFNCDSEQSVLDVGCGPGTYVREMRKLGMKAYGVDIDIRCLKTPHCEVVDIVNPPFLSIYEPDTVISLEVGEHIPAKDSWNYISYISYQGPKMVIFSAAAPGQGGDGHINCQNKSYWACRFERFGYTYDGKATEEFLQYLIAGPHMGWLRNNVMIFYRF